MSKQPQESSWSLVRRSLTVVKIAAFGVLLEQLYEVAVLGVSLAENPIIVIAALGALGFPAPRESHEKET